LEYGDLTKNFYSTKYLINSTKVGISDRPGYDGNRVPDDLRTKINKILSRNQSKKGKEHSQATDSNVVNVDRIR
jgi:hypothetical protein